jgi:hypothetical protein
MTTTIHRWAAAALASAPFLLMGCRSGYDLDIRNLTDQPVVARINVPHADGAARTLVQGRLGPGDRGSLFHQAEYGSRVWLEVDFEGNVGYPATLDLSVGKTVVNVRRTDEGSRGKIRLEEVQRP